MLRIVGQENANGAGAMLRLEGQVIGPWVEELRLACEPILARGERLSLDLSAVSFVGREGVQLLWALEDRQVTVLKCSSFVAEQLKAPTGMAT